MRAREARDKPGTGATGGIRAFLNNSSPTLPAVLILMTAAWFLIGAGGDFPLNDDWAYASSVRHLLEDGRLIFSDWTSPFALPMIFSAALFCKIVGYGAASLRVVTLLWSLSGLIFLDKLLDARRVQARARWLALGVLFFNPHYFLLSFSFHSDVSFVALSLGAIFFLIKSEESDRAGPVVAASVFCAAAALTRQIGVLLPVAATAWWVIRKRAAPDRLLRLWLVPALSVGIFLWWYKTAHGPTWAQVNYVAQGTLRHLSSPGPFLAETFKRSLDALLLSALFASPFLFLKSEKTGKPNLAVDTILLALAVALAAYLISRGRPASYLDNLFHRKGLGTLTIYHSHGWKPAALWGNPWLWRFYAGLSAAALWAFLRRLFYTAWPDGSKHLLVLSLPLALATLPGLKFFDRYVLQWFTVFLLLLPVTALRVRRPAWAALAFWALVCLAGGRDYFAWNEAKWELGLEGARRLNVPPGRVANGFDWNAHWNYEAHMAELKSEKPLDRIGEWEWEKLDRARALISYAPDDGPPRDRLLSTTYRSPLAPRGAALYLFALPERDARGAHSAPAEFIN